MNIDIKVGDLVLSGKFKNKKNIIKSFSKDELNQPTIITDTGKEIKLLAVRINKIMPKKEKKNEELSLVKLFESKNESFTDRAIKTEIIDKVGHDIQDIIMKYRKNNNMPMEYLVKLAQKALSELSDIYKNR